MTVIASPRGTASIHFTLALALALAGSVVLAACGGGSGPAATADAVAPSAAAASPSGDDPTPVPNPGATDAPAGVFPVDGGPIPGAEPTLVTPVAGATDIREVVAAGIEATTDGDRVVARVTWWSGVDPCTVLAGLSVDADPDGIHFSVTVREGNGAAPGTMCTEQAILKAAVVDLAPAVAGNTYIVSAAGAPDSVTLVLD